MTQVTNLLYEGGDLARTFIDLYPTREDFVGAYNLFGSEGIPKTISDESCGTLYYLLVAKYGRAPLAGLDEQTSEIQIFTTVYEHGGAWERRRQIQDELRSLTIDEMMHGGSAVYNAGQNPDTSPLTTEEDGIRISSQNRTIYKRSKMEAYGQLKALLEEDVTEQFIKRFAYVFKKVLAPFKPVLYGTEGGENDGTDNY